MLFWKIDEETIRCLINRDEIGQMGYDPDTLSDDHMLMDEFLDAIVKQSKNYLSWNTENGIQTYAASPLPSDQFLITISCTFTDDMIDRDLDQIRRMTNAMSRRITEDRIDRIYSLSGEEKEEAFRELARDLHEVCSGSSGDEDADDTVQVFSGTPVKVGKDPQSPPSGHPETGGKETGSRGEEGHNHISRYPDTRMSFPGFSSLVDFVSVLNRDLYFPSALHKDRDEYVLLVSFPSGTSGSKVSSFILTAEEYGASCSSQAYEAGYYNEHGRLLIPEDGIRLLSTMGR